MIIELLLTALYNIFSVLTSVISIPQLPSDINEYLDTAFSYIESGVGILANYSHIGYLLTLFGVLVAIDVGISIYHFVMWVIRKIPMASMS